MTQESLEEVKTPAEEVVEPTPPAEGDKPVKEAGASKAAEGEKPTPGAEKEPTISITETPEFKTALDKAVGKGVSSIQSQLSTQKQATEAAKDAEEEAKANTSILEAEIQDLKKQQDDLAALQFADDPAAMTAFKDRRAIADERRELAKKTAIAERKLGEAEKLAWSAGMARKADALVLETGIDIKELEKCQTEDEMEVVALRFEKTKEPEKKEPVKAPKFDKAITSPGGEMPGSAKDKMKAGWAEIHK